VKIAHNFLMKLLIYNWVGSLHLLNLACFDHVS